MTADIAVSADVQSYISGPPGPTHTLQDNRVRQPEARSASSHSVSISPASMDADVHGQVWASARHRDGRPVGSPSEITGDTVITLNGVESRVSGFVNAGLLVKDINNPTGYRPNPAAFGAPQGPRENTVSFSPALSGAMAQVERALSANGSKMDRVGLLARFMSGKGVAIREAAGALSKAGLSEQQITGLVSGVREELRSAEEAALRSAGLTHRAFLDAVKATGKESHLRSARLRLASGSASAIVEMAQSIAATRPSAMADQKIDPSKVRTMMVNGTEVVDLKPYGLPEMSKAAFIRMARDGSLDRLVGSRR